MIPAIDISKYQGAWKDRGEAIDMIKMSGGDDGLYMDSMASSNYTQAKAHGKGVGGYHFIGWTLGASAEATYFLQAMSPLAENDVYALDIEAIKTADPVAYVTEMVSIINSKIGVFPLLYMNLSTLRAYDWSALLKDCGLWLADWNNDPAGTIPNVPIYVMQQYSDGPVYDHDEWLGTLEEFNAYGWHAPAVTTPVPTVVPTPPAPVPTQAPDPNTPTRPTPVVVAPLPTPPVITTTPTPTVITSSVTSLTEPVITYTTSISPPTAPTTPSGGQTASSLTTLQNSTSYKVSQSRNWWSKVWHWLWSWL